MGNTIQSIPYDQHTTAGRDLLVVEEGYIIENTETETFQMNGAGGWIDVFQDDNMFYYNATVGTDGDYSTIQEALADGKYRIKLISDVTETVDWGAHTNEIVIGADEMTIVNVSVSNTSPLTIKANNINFSITGVNRIFDDTTFNLGVVLVTGDSSDNNFGEGVGINAEKLTIDIGTGYMRMQYLKDIKHLHIMGSNNLDYSYIYVAGKVDYLETSGTFSDLNLQRFLLLTNSVLLNVQHNATGGSINITRGSQILGSNGNPITIFTNDSDNVVKNCNINQLYLSGTTTDDVVENCVIDNLIYGQLKGQCKSFKNNTISTNLDLIINKSIIENCAAASIKIGIANCDINYCISTSGTITVDATADKTNIVGCRTLTPIVDNGTNTQIIAPNLI